MSTDEERKKPKNTYINLRMWLSVYRRQTKHLRFFRPFFSRAAKNKNVVLNDYRVKLGKSTARNQAI